MPYYPPGPVLATVATNSVTTDDQTFALDAGTQVIFEQADGDDILTLDEATKNAEFTNRVGIKEAGLSYPAFDTDAYFANYLLREVGQSGPYEGVGFYIQNKQVNGYTEYYAINDISDIDDLVGFTMGVGGSQTADQYENAAYFYTTPNTNYLFFQVTKPGGYVRIDVGGSDNEIARFDDNATARNTRFMIWDVDNGQMERVSVGIADSGGAGFKLLRIPN